MERKNTILLTVIAVATLLVAVVGATFAYFTASITDDRTSGDGNGNTSLQTGQIPSSTVVANVSGSAGSFTASDIYPGHKEVAAMSVEATGANSKTGVTFNYNITENGLGDNVKVSLYKSTTEVQTGTSNYFNCSKKTGTAGDDSTFFEECTGTETSLGTKVKEVTLTNGAQTITLGNDTISVGASETSKKVYYYVVVEFVNKQESQNSVMSTKLAGQVTVAASAV